MTGQARYRIRIEEPEPYDYEYGTFVDGVIDLDDEGKRRIESALERLHDEGVIGSWTIERDEPFPVFTETGVFNCIIGADPEAEADNIESVRRLWEGTRQPVTN